VSTPTRPPGFSEVLSSRVPLKDRLLRSASITLPEMCLPLFFVPLSDYLVAVVVEFPPSVRWSVLADTGGWFLFIVAFLRLSRRKAPPVLLCSRPFRPLRLEQAPPQSYFAFLGLIQMCSWGGFGLGISLPFPFGWCIVLRLDVFCFFSLYPDRALLFT